MFVYLSLNYLLQESGEEPAVYTKLACFLPWIAEQYQMDFTENLDDGNKECTFGNGDKNDTNIDACRSNSPQEHECIFPFYWNGKLIDQCIFLEQSEFLIPVFRCPIRNITRKFEGINSFRSQDFFRGKFVVSPVPIDIIDVVNTTIVFDSPLPFDPLNGLVITNTSKILVSCSDLDSQVRKASHWL